MKVLPITIKVTPRTMVVELSNNRQIKLTMSSTRTRLSGHLGRMERERVVVGVRWSSEQLGLHGLTRLEMEKELLNLNGWELEKHWESMPEWNLSQKVSK